MKGEAGGPRIVLRILAWSLAAVGFALTAVGELAVIGERGVVATIFSVAPTLGFAVVGGLLGARRPHNPIGWLITATVALSGLDFVAELVYLPSTAVMVTFLPLLFPTGRPPTPRWRWAGWTAGVGVGLLMVGAAVEPFAGEQSALALVALVPGLGAAVVAGAASVVSLVVRFRRSRGIERLQLRWIGFAWSLVFVVLVVTFALSIPVPEAAIEAAVLTIPIAIGVAIFRYRLYEIDRIISRTVTYGLVAGVLAAVYAGGVFLVQQVIGAEGDLAVAASTLAAFALFAPLRRRVQRGVDRRFNRSRYDAARVVEGLASKLRDRVELEVVTAELVGAARSALQPATVAVWVRGER